MQVAVDACICLAYSVRNVQECVTLIDIKWVLKTIWRLKNSVS